jgi:hypothetical protein
MPFPPLVRVRRTFDASCIEDVAGAVRRELERILPEVPPAAPIAVGSRGITDIRIIVHETVLVLKSKGAAPFITPSTPPPPSL